MKVMILAAGYGKRMLPITKETPKPLLKVSNKTLIQRNIEILINSGFNEIVPRNNQHSETYSAMLTCVLMVHFVCSSDCF